MNDKYVTEDRLEKALEKTIKIMSKELGDRIDKAFKIQREESDKRIMAFEKAQTDRLLMALSKYGSWTEKHEKFYNHIKDGFKDDQ